jgi:hypothetical protein
MLNDLIISRCGVSHGVMDASHLGRMLHGMAEHSQHCRDILTGLMLPPLPANLMLFVQGSQ